MSSNIVNFKAQILEELAWNGETEDQIEAFEIEGTGVICNYFTQDPRNINRHFCNTPLKWKDFSHLLDYDTDTSYGRLYCHRVTVWTPKFVYFVHEYDGSHYIDYIKRNP